MADYHYEERDRARNYDRGSNRSRSGSMFGGWNDDHDGRRDRSRYSGNSDRDRDRERGRMRDDDRSRGRQTDNERFGNRDSDRNVAINETRQLIASNKVEGTPVYSRRGDRLGSVYNLMLDKRSGEVKYAVMTYGGFLGMGADYYPVPWSMLRYDTREDGYVVDMDSDDLRRAPSFRRGEEPNFDRDYDSYVNRWYGI